MLLTIMAQYRAVFGITNRTRSHLRSSLQLFSLLDLCTHGNHSSSTKIPSWKAEVNAKYSRYKSWRVTMFIPWGALLMTIGFIMREVGAFDIENLGILIASIVLLMSGP